jgi:predicted branched-subunit amino acid permease
VGKITRDRARLWKPEKSNGVSLFKAEFHHFAFRKHTHDEFAIGAIEEGAQRFFHGGGTHVIVGGGMISVNPDEVHDGQTADADGYRYRITYIHPDMVGEILSELFDHGNAFSWFKSPMTYDPQLSACLCYAHRLMEQDGNDFMEAQTSLMRVVAETFLRYGENRRSPRPAGKSREVVGKALEYISRHATENISLEEIAKAAGLSRYHFLRRFKATTGLPPHAYLIQQRVRLGKKAIEGGSPWRMPPSCPGSRTRVIFPGVSRRSTALLPVSTGVPWDFADRGFLLKNSNFVQDPFFRLLLFSVAIKDKETNYDEIFQGRICCKPPGGPQRGCLRQCFGNPGRPEGGRLSGASRHESVHFCGVCPVCDGGDVDSSVAVVEITMAVLAINLRYLLIGASLNPVFEGTFLKEKLLMMHLVSDENWAVTMAAHRRGEASPLFLLGGGVCICAFWCMGTLLGHGLGAVIERPEAYALDFALIAVFTALTVSMWRGRQEVLPWLVAAVCAVAAEKLLPGKWYIIIGGFAGALVPAILSGGDVYETEVADDVS